MCGSRPGERRPVVSAPAPAVAPQPTIGAAHRSQRRAAPSRTALPAPPHVSRSPASRGRTWDVILGDYGPDVAFLDRALAAAFARCAVDPARLAIGGFSDGASYALSLGLTNGDLFGHVLAYSPGFAAPAGQRGHPRLFVSHGTRDEVLPIDVCSRRIVPRLKGAGYDVTYREFDGPHTVPPEIAREGLDWFLAGRGTPTAS